ncbi:PHD-finger domain-containing protein [Colletotrichum plurivorum]|uniref:PHD-finger domain-containing protein n=1 Tax=Colletotrichum plurivorum TaxID=2175906 RepID=A0A8H6JLX5_9PEZI|nr:PHD-finger domain-containing protein [Colletotrichum plurivorum]
MVSSRKPTMQETAGSQEREPSLLHRVRNQWQFANLCQWIYLFGKVVKIDDSLDTEEIEAECLKPNAPILQDIGLALLKFISSHRGLTHELFDEYTRRQYISRAPEKNPFGSDEPAAKFAEFDVLTKISILQQLTQWVMLRPERVREKMEEQKDVEQASWRIEPIGWDREDRTYFVLDDNRVYRLTDPPPKPVTPKKKGKTTNYASRPSKRRRVSTATAAEDPNRSVNEPTDATTHSTEDSGLGGMKWECLAVSLGDVQALVASFHKTKDDNEKVLRDQLQEHLLPILEKQEDSRKRKELQRQRELLNLAKMANAKRSSRIASKVEQQKQEEKTKEEAQILLNKRAAARKEEQKRIKLERERDSRLLSREHRLKEREARRSQHERELSQLSEDNRNGSGRVSERRLQAEIERNKRALQELEDEEGDWIFDCICGAYGQVDDGTHSVACEKCNVWQHSKCVGISEIEAERSEFHFICQTCRRRTEEAAHKPRTTIKLKVNRPLNTSPSSLPQASPPTSSAGLGVEFPSLQEATDRAAQEVQLDHHHAAVGPGAQANGCNYVSSVGSTATSQEPVDETQPHNATSAASSSELSAHPGRTPFVKETGLRPSTPKGEDDEVGDSSDQYFNNLSLSASHDMPQTNPLRPGATPGPPDDTSPRPGVSSLMATPIISREHGIPGSSQSSFALPASEGGLSPTKHSPPLPRPQPASSKTPALPAVLPPIATLSPSPRQQILTPPIKPVDPARRYQTTGTTPGGL